MEGRSPDHTIMVGEEAGMEEGWTTNVEGTCRLEAHETEASELAELFSTSLSYPHPLLSLLFDQNLGAQGRKPEFPSPLPQRPRVTMCAADVGLHWAAFLKPKWAEG